MRRNFLFFLSLLYFAVNVPFAHAAESRFWEDRKRASRRFSGAAEEASRPAQLMAQLPAAARVSFSAVSKAPPLLAETGVPSGLSSLLSYGSLRSLHRSSDPKAPFIVHIQDAHEIEDAQRNAAAMIGELSSGGGPLLVGLEGAAGAFAVEAYRAAPDAEVARAMAEHFLRRGTIGGAEFAALTLPRPPLLWGVENPLSYGENVRALKDSHARKAAAEALLSAASIALEAAKEKSYSPALREFDRRTRGYRASGAGLGEYAAYLAGVAGGKDFKNVALLLRALALETSLDFAAVERSRRDLVETLSRKVPSSGLDLLVRRSVDYRLGRLGAGPYHAFLKDFCRGHGVPLSSFPGVEDYIRYVSLADSIDREALLEELPRLEAAAQDSLAKTAEHKRLAADGRRLALVEKLLRHAMTPSDWAAYEEDREGVVAAVGALSGKSGVPELLGPSEDFCRRALGRNEALVDNLLAKASAEKASVAVLVAGGFHTEGLTRLLRERNVSYAVLSPKISSVPTGHDALEAFTREARPLEKLFAGEVISLKYPPSLAADTPEAKAMAALHAAAQVALAGTPLTDDQRRAMVEALPHLDALKAEIKREGGRPLHRFEMTVDGQEVSADVLVTTQEKLSIVRSLFKGRELDVVDVPVRGTSFVMLVLKTRSTADALRRELRAAFKLSLWTVAWRESFKRLNLIAFLRRHELNPQPGWFRWGTREEWQRGAGGMAVLAAFTLVAAPLFNIVVAAAPGAAAAAGLSAFTLTLAWLATIPAQWAYDQLALWRGWAPLILPLEDPAERRTFLKGLRERVEASLSSLDPASSEPAQYVAALKTVFADHQRAVWEGAGADTLELRMGLYTEGVDVFVEALFERSLARYPGARGRLHPVAVGSYGRREMVSSSDVDIWLATDDESPEKDAALLGAAQFMEQILWKVSGRRHSVSLMNLRDLAEDVRRSAGEKLLSYRPDQVWSLRKEDQLAQVEERRLLYDNQAALTTRLLDMRSLSGDSVLSGRLSDIRRDVLSSLPLADRLRHMTSAWNLAYSRHHAAGLRLNKPNLKTGLGGAMDYHRLRWLSEVVAEGLLSEAEMLRAREVFRRIQILRVKLSALGAPADVERRLDAEWLWDLARGMEDRHGDWRRTLQPHPSQPPEVADAVGLMRDYYALSDELFGFFQKAMLKALDRAFPPKAWEAEPFILESAPHLQPLGKVFGLVRRRGARFRTLRGFETGEAYEVAPIGKEGNPFSSDPALAVEVFEAAARLGVFLSVETVDALRAARPAFEAAVAAADPAFRERVNRSFFSLLSLDKDISEVMWEMHRSGVLLRFIPEMERLRDVVQMEDLHDYAADAHLLKALEQFESIRAWFLGGPGKNDEGYRDLRAVFRWAQVHGHLGTIRLAILLHDLGKPAWMNPPNTEVDWVGAHEQAPPILARLGIAPSDLRHRVIRWLIENDVMLYKASKRKPLVYQDAAGTNKVDPSFHLAFIESYVGKVASTSDISEALSGVPQDFLSTTAHLLPLLDFADASGTKPSDVGRALDRVVPYTFILDALARKDPDMAQVEGLVENDMRDAVRQRLEGEGLPAEELLPSLERYFDVTPFTFWLGRPPRDVSQEVKMLWEMEGDKTPVKALVRDPGNPLQPFEVIIAVREDRWGLLSAMTGVMAAHGMDVIYSQVNSGRSGRILNRFLVRFSAPPGPIKKLNELLNADLLSVVKSEAGVADVFALRRRDALFRNPSPRPVSVEFEDAPDDTLRVSIRASDFAGLLHLTTRIMGEVFGLSVYNAAVNTEGPAAFDTFRVVSVDTGRKPSAAQQENLRRALSEVLSRREIHPDRAVDELSRKYKHTSTIPSPMALLEGPGPRMIVRPVHRSILMSSLLGGAATSRTVALARFEADESVLRERALEKRAQVLEARRVFAAALLGDADAGDPGAFAALSLAELHKKGETLLGPSRPELSKVLDSLELRVPDGHVEEKQRAEVELLLFLSVEEGNPSAVANAYNRAMNLFDREARLSEASGAGKTVVQELSASLLAADSLAGLSDVDRGIVDNLLRQSSGEGPVAIVVPAGESVSSVTERLEALDPAFQGLRGRLRLVAKDQLTREGKLSSDLLRQVLNAKDVPLEVFILNRDEWIDPSAGDLVSLLVMIAGDLVCDATVRLAHETERLNFIRMQA